MTATHGLHVVLALWIHMDRTSFHQFPGESFIGQVRTLINLMIVMAIVGGERNNNRL
jgi:hypothetical protein